LVIHAWHSRLLLTGTVRRRTHHIKLYITGVSLAKRQTKNISLLLL